MLAIRDLRGNYALRDVLLPIIEPVNRDGSRLIRTLNEFGEAGDNLIVVTNPHQHEFHAGVGDAWIGPVDGAIVAHPSLIPGLLCTHLTTAQEVRTFLAHYRDRDVALLYMNARFTDAAVQQLAAQPHIRFHVNLQERMSAAQRAFLPRNKVVDVRDDFQLKARNSDYEGIEFFTDRHLNFQNTAVGFGDYTILGATFQAGGGQPAAVAIHATFKDRGAVWVEHFVSDDIERDVGTVGQKFLQAAGKLVVRANEAPRSFGRDQVLRDYQADVAGQHFPGLPKNKERQIYHHLALMHQVLTGAL